MYVYKYVCIYMPKNNKLIMFMVNGKHKIFVNNQQYFQ